MKRELTAAIAAVLAAATLTGCGMGASDLMAGIRPSTSRQTVTDVSVLLHNTFLLVLSSRAVPKT